jgi:uncharacterized Fe-S radical SAM superfamily protein PflX
VRLIAVLAVATFAASAMAAEPKKPARVPMPVVQTKAGEKCVEPTEVMRRDHMKFILHQRDETMHRGVRTVKHSFKNCVNCHTDPTTNSVLGKDGFCQSCHTHAAVKIDCFECHTAAPEPAKAAAAPKTSVGH